MCWYNNQWISYSSNWLTFLQSCNIIIDEFILIWHSTTIPIIPLQSLRRLDRVLQRIRSLVRQHETLRGRDIEDKVDNLYGVVSDQNAEDSEMIQIIDNVVSEDHAKYLSGIFDDNFAWYATPTALSTDEFWSNSAVLFSSDQQRPIMSPRHIHFLPILFNACREQNIKVNQVLRIRCGLIYKDQGGDKHKSHIDLLEPHKTLIYYVNDSDGPTKIYKGDEVIQEIHPKKGRCFIMNGDIPHSSSHPKKHSHRIVVNINFN